MSREPLVLLHGFTDTARTWDLVRPALERTYDVLTPTLPGHMGGPPLPSPLTDDSLVDATISAMDEAGIDTAHVCGNSLGGHVALQLAARGRARTVTALAPAGGWAPDDPAIGPTLERFAEMRELLRMALPRMDKQLSTARGRRRATALYAERSDHIPAELIAHQLLGVVRCDGLDALVAHARTHGWPTDPEAIRCPVRFVWGTSDRVLPQATSTAMFRTEAWAHADWVELEGVGHCPQLDVPLETVEVLRGWAVSQ